MNIYERLIENPLFFKWIYHPSKEIKSYWKSYMKLYPEEAPHIKEFKNQFDKYLKHTQPELSLDEKLELAQRIIKELEKLDNNMGRKLFLWNFMRYAAVALIFFTIGSGLVYLYMESSQPTFVVENPVLPSNVHEPVLIIDDSKEIQLGGKKPVLNYSKQGEIVLNNKEIIDNTTEKGKAGVNTLVVPYGSMSTITLADGSKVWLNAGSRLIYPSNFTDKKREVFLVGEAFFDVTKNNDKPFVITTPDIEIEVLGTRFNVSAYPDDYSVQTVLEEGSVEVNYADASIFEKGVLLKPGQMASFNKKSKQTNVQTVNINHYTLWTEGLFSFSNSDLSRIVKNIERYYNIKIRYKDPINGTIKVTGKLDVTKSKEEVLGYLSKLTDLEFTKLNNWQYEIR